MSLIIDQLYFQNGQLNTFLGDVGGLPTKWRNKHLKHSQKRTNAILKLGTVFDTHGLRPSRGQQQLNQSQKISISKGNLNKFLGDVGGLPRWRTTHLEHL